MIDRSDSTDSDRLALISGSVREPSPVPSDIIVAPKPQPAPVRATRPVTVSSGGGRNGEGGAQSKALSPGHSRVRCTHKHRRRLPKQSISSAVHLQASRPAGSRGFRGMYGGSSRASCSRDDTTKAGAKTVYFSVDEMSLIARSVDGLSVGNTSGWVTVTTSSPAIRLIHLFNTGSTQRCCTRTTTTSSSNRRHSTKTTAGLCGATARKRKRRMLSGSCRCASVP